MIMNNLSKFWGPMVLLTGVLGTCNVAAAGATVFQRTENTKSIELSNIEEEGALPVAVETGATQMGAKAAVQIPSKTQEQPVPPVVAKKKSATDSADDAEIAEGEEPVTRQGRADANRAGDHERNENVIAINPANDGASTSSLGDVVYSGIVGGSSSGATVSSGGAGTAVSTGAGTATATGTGASSGTGSVPSIPSVSNVPTATSALDTKLEQYRNQMLQEVVNAQVSNPAITRRYQMMDKATYQSRGGL
jgi:hypothetical protein